MSADLKAGPYRLCRGTRFRAGNLRRPLSTLTAYLRPYPEARQNERSSCPFSTRPAPKYLDLDSSANFYRSRMRADSSSPLPLSGGRPAVSFRAEGAIAPGCDSR